MHMNLKRILAMLLCLTLLVGLLPAGLAAAEDNIETEEIASEELITLIDEEPSEEADEIIVIDSEEDEEPAAALTPELDRGFSPLDDHSELYINPAYRDSFTDDEILELCSRNVSAADEIQADNVPYYSTISSAVSYFKGQMVSRNESITFMIPESAVTSSGTLLRDMYNKAVEHTESCSGREGDALKWGTGGWSASWSTSTNASGVYCYQLSYTMRYNSTAAQESSLTTKVNSVMSSLNLSGKTEREKIRAIYDYICDHVDYDHDHLSDSSYRAQFTAYAALCEGKAVCQGYAVLFYRMCKEAGLSVRVVTSYNHAWNIVRIGSVYYNVDSTWDGQDEETRHNYYLKGPRDFQDHPREYPYYTDEFENAHPMVKDSAMNASNISCSFTTIDGKTVSSTASGKPKILIFGNYSTDQPALEFLNAFCDYGISGLDVYAIDVKKSDKATMEAAKAAICQSSVVFCRDDTDGAWNSMCNYLGAVDYPSYTILYPVIILIDANNNIQDYRVCDQGPGTVAALISRFLGVTPKLTGPRIQTQPSSVSTQAGNDAVFTVNHLERGQTVTYQWYYRTSSSGDWNKTTSTGSKTSSLHVTAETYRSGYQYRCALKNDYGTTYSKTVTLTVVSKPTITTQPSSVNTAAGNTASFTVKASGGSLSYQWYYRTSSSGSWNKCSSGGYNTATYSVTATTARSGYQYRCLVKNSAGSVYTNTVTLTVGSTSSKPTITTQPKSVNAAAGSTVAFVVKASGATSYQWYYRTSSSGSWNKCSSGGYNTSTYTVEATTARNGYQYRCLVKNSAGSVYTNTVTLTVGSTTSKPTITTQPKSVTTTAGSTVAFVVKASGATSYQWYYRTSSSGSWNKCSSGGYNTSTYTVEATTARNGYQYRCEVKNSAGSVYTSTVTLTVGKPSITTQPSSKSVNEGSSVSFKVVATGVSSYQWYYRSSSSGSWNKCSSGGYNTATYTVTATNARNGYQYRCALTNSVGTVYTNTVTLTVNTVKYRALLIGEVAFSPVCTRNEGDVRLVKSMLQNVEGAKGGKYSITTKINVTDTQIQSAISSTFSAADSNDVSLFFIASHGITSEASGVYAGAIATVDADGNQSLLTMSDLASWLGAIPGKVIVMIGSCGSGAAIYPNGLAQSAADDLFNQSVIQAFSQQEELLRMQSGDAEPNLGEFRTSKFYVLTAAAHQQSSWGCETGDPSTCYNFFTFSLTQGVGGSKPADTNNNGVITMLELYNYIKQNASGPYNGTEYQDVQMYPENSTYALFK